MYQVHIGDWKTGKWAIADKNGKWLTPPIFEDYCYILCNDFLEFYITPENTEEGSDMLYGVYDLKNGRVLFEPQFYDIHFNDNDTFTVQVYDELLKEKIYKIIDIKGNEILSLPGYSFVYYTDNNQYIKVKDDDTTNIDFEIKPYKLTNLVKIEHYQKIPTSTLEIISPSNTHANNIMNIKPYKDQFTHGTTIHEILEHLPIKKWTIDDLQKYNLNTKDINHLLTFNNSKLFSKAYDHQVFKEYPFITKKDNKIINGTMDLVLINDEEVIIVDYKTNKNMNKNELIDLYKNQLDIYGNIMKKVYPNHKIYKYIYAFELDEAIAL